MSKFWWKNNLEHKSRIFEIVILNTKWKDCQSRKNLCTKKITYTKKFYVHEIAAVNLSKIYFLKNAKKTCKPNNCDLNRDWINSPHFPFKKNVWRILPQNTADIFSESSNYFFLYFITNWWTGLTSIDLSK